MLYKLLSVGILIQRNGADRSKTNLKLRSIMENIEENVIENSNQIEILNNGLFESVEPQIQSMESKFDKIDNNLANIAIGIDENDLENRDVRQNVEGLQELVEKVDTQEKQLVELKRINEEGAKKVEQIELVKEDFILLKQEVFGLQELQKNLTSETLMWIIPVLHFC